MKYYIIAGEASGDLHGANLIKEIILQIKEENHPEREKSLDFLIYNVLNNLSYFILNSLL